MSEVIDTIKKQLEEHGLRFGRKPILIGGMAMQYYGMRKSGADIDLVISDEDYQSLAHKYPEKRKDIWGDLGVVIGPFEIWRCIMLLDYDFFSKEAIEEDVVFVVSIDRLLLMRVFAREIPKYKADLALLQNYYLMNYRNQSFVKEAEKHFSSYSTHEGGIIYGGNYTE